MDIQVNEYIRTIYGDTGKVTAIYPRIYWIKQGNKNVSELSFNLIKKHTFNKYEILEKGDFTTWHNKFDKEKRITHMGIIKEIQFNNLGQCNVVYLEDGTEEGRYLSTHEYIKSIVTKEQLKSVQYNFEEE